MNKLPKINTKPKVLIICEGGEEYDYLTRLKNNCTNWSDNYNVDIKSANSIDNLFNKYTFWFSANKYEIIFIFCDTEVPPYRQYEELKNNINSFHGSSVANKIIFFANPCTMQIILSHFEYLKLKSNKKTDNMKKIQQLTGVRDYRAKENEREAICKKITPENYIVMKENLRKISTDEKTVPSTNALTLFKYLDNSDISWIAAVNSEIYTD